MADKRCFAKSVVESDAFYSLSKVAQALYLHLSMNADNYGFVGNSVSIMRTGGFNKSSKTELLQHRFILDCGDGVIVIKAWNTNNTLRHDRYLKPTVYTEALSKLFIKENGSYTESADSGAVPAMTGISSSYDRHNFANMLEENRKEKNVCVSECETHEAYIPTVSDVAAFSAEEGLSFDAEAFVQYNQARGWKIHGAPVEDWKALARMWAAKETIGSPEPAPTADNDQTDAFGNPIKRRWQ